MQVTLARRLRRGSVGGLDLLRQPPHAVLKRHLRRLVVMVPVMTGFIRVVVGSGGSADLLLEARQGYPVDAEIAVHSDVARIGLAVALQDEIRHPRVRSEVAGMAHLDTGVLRGKPLALVPYAFLEHAGEQEVGEDYDAPGAKLFAPLEDFCHARGGEAHEGGLDKGVRTALVEEAGYLGEVRVRVRI